VLGVVVLLLPSSKTDVTHSVVAVLVQLVLVVLATTVVRVVVAVVVAVAVGAFGEVVAAAEEVVVVVVVVVVGDGTVVPNPHTGESGGVAFKCKQVRGDHGWACPGDLSCTPPRPSGCSTKRDIFFWDTLSCRLLCKDDVFGFPNESDANASPGELPRGDVGAEPPPMMARSSSSSMVLIVVVLELLVLLLRLPLLPVLALAAAAVAGEEVVAVVVLEAEPPFDASGQDVPRVFFFCFFSRFFSRDDPPGVFNAKGDGASLRLREGPGLYTVLLSVLAPWGSSYASICGDGSFVAECVMATLARFCFRLEPPNKPPSHDCRCCELLSFCIFICGRACIFDGWCRRIPSFKLQLRCK